MTTLDHLIEAFENESFCDVEIKLEDGSILRAHAVILKLGSIWFQRRLNENWSTDGPVLCDNHASRTMKDVIKFLYTSSITISVENVEELYMIADYYSIDRLSKMCTDFLHENIGLLHVFEILMMADKYNLIELKDNCLCFLDSNIEELLLSGGEAFYLTPTHVLIAILERYTLCIHEELLFDHILLWMEGVTDADKNETWIRLTPHIRFTSMSIDYYVDKVVNKKIVSDTVSLNVMQFLTSLPFAHDLNHVPRRCITGDDIVIQRFRRTSESSMWIVDNSMDGDRIAFTVNNNMKLRGVLLYGNENVNFLVTAALYDENLDLLQKIKIRHHCNEDKTFPLVFPKPVDILDGHKYTIIVNMTGGTTYFGEERTARVSRTLRTGFKLKSTFYDVGVGSATLDKGQIKGLILKL